MEPDTAEDSSLPLQQQLGIPEEMFELAAEYDPNRKSRAAKKREKIEKRRKMFEDPQHKRRERLKKRRRVRDKLKKETVGMTREQIGQYLNSKKQFKEKIKHKMAEAVTKGLPILIDLVYEEHMNAKERTSLAVQIELIYKSMRKLDNPCSLHLCSLGNTIEEQLIGMRYHFWPMTSHKESVAEVAKKLGREPIYLSPDGREELKEVNTDHVYIIGGLVDRTVLKNASLNRAEELGIKAYRLPIDTMMQNRKCLNLDHVSLLLCKYLELKDWAKAFDYAAPKRFKREGEEGEGNSSEEEKKKQGEESSSSESENSQDDPEESQQPPLVPKELEQPEQPPTAP